MADQGVSNERKKELAQMDSFQESLVRGMAYAAKHKKQLFMGLGALAVVLILFVTIIYSFKRSETTAASLVGKASATYAKTYNKTQDPKAAYEAVKASYEKVFDEYANTSAGKMAQVSYAKICFDAGEYDKAYTYYSRALESLDNQAGMENMLLMALGNLAQMKHEPEKAKSFYLRIENGTSDLLKDEARFALASIYESEKDMESSLKMYEKILRDNKNSMYRAIAQARVGGE